MKRRDFLKNILGAGVAAGFPTIVPAAVLGRGGAVAPSERINLAAVGLGTQGTSNMQNFFGDRRVQVVGLCDVNNTEGRQYYGYSNNTTYGLRAARKLFGSDIPCYNDYRQMLAELDIDAICSSLPDHWHAVSGIDYVKAGKDVYGEKPLTRTIREGRVLRDVVQSSGCIWQTGSWQRSLPQFVRAVEIVRSGALGEIRRIEITVPGNFVGEVLAPEPVPQGFDYELWQGPALHSSFYNPRRTFTRWRGVSNYSAGKIADWGAHHLDIALWATDAGKKGFVEAVPEYVEWQKDGFSDQPVKFRVSLFYDNLEIAIMDMTSDRRFASDSGVMFYGTKGKLFISRETFYSQPLDIISKRIAPTDERVFPIRSGNHFTAFIDSVIDRRIATTDIGEAHRTNTGCLLAEIAYRLNRPIKWDADREEIVGDPLAARMCDRVYTAPWQLRA